MNVDFFCSYKVNEKEKEKLPNSIKRYIANRGSLYCMGGHRAATSGQQPKFLYLKKKKEGAPSAELPHCGVWVQRGWRPTPPMRQACPWKGIILQLLIAELSILTAANCTSPAGGVFFSCPIQWIKAQQIKMVNTQILILRSITYMQSIRLGFIQLQNSHMKNIKTTIYCIN